MRGKFHTIVNNTWYSILFDHKLTKLFSIENFSGAKHAGKVLIIIIILFLMIIIRGLTAILTVLSYSTD